MESKTDEFESLTVEQMLEAVSMRLSSERASAKAVAEGNLSILNEEKVALLQELEKINSEAALLAMSSVTAENIDEKATIDDNYVYEPLEPKPIPQKKVTVCFQTPERATEIEKRISDLNAKICTEKTKAALDLDYASSDKELDLVYLFRRMRHDTPRWDQPSKISKKISRVAMEDMGDGAS